MVLVQCVGGVYVCGVRCSECEQASLSLPVLHAQMHACMHTHAHAHANTHTHTPNHMSLENLQCTMCIDSQRPLLGVHIHIPSGVQSNWEWKWESPFFTIHCYTEHPCKFSGTHRHDCNSMCGTQYPVLCPRELLS